ncbi:MAG TPA: hypothetical protein VNC23_14740 [Lapillicoccus sp.]|jgi:hypothetical protein|nr:hypothetical protein [Lapillicoccus sp.]
MSDARDETTDLSTDEGVPVGDADVQADIDRASGDGGADEPSTEDFLKRGQAEMASDDGETTGAADVDADRENTGGGGAAG